MSLNNVIYPYNIEARKLPIHLTGIGGTDWQQPISRPTGYHWHQIILSEGGEGMLNYDNLSIKINPGDCIFLPANYPHSYRAASGSWKVKFITFDGYSAIHILSLFGMTKPVVISLTDDRVFTSLFSQMYRYVTTDRLHGDVMCSGLTYQYILEFYSRMDLRQNHSKIERSELLTNALRYIEDNYREDFPLSALSDMAGVSHQHFCRIFKDAMNIRPKEYVNRLRIREAKRLLRETDKSIAEIAKEVGFSESAYFCAVFKKSERLSPLEYRKSVGLYGG